MTSSKPYLIRALYEWIADNDMTPFIIVDATKPNVAVPKKHVRNDKIILNISSLASHNLRIGNDAVECQAAFSGTSFHIYVPIPAVLAIYARETGQGMTFPPEKIPATETKTKKNQTVKISASEKDKIIPFNPKAG